VRGSPSRRRPDQVAELVRQVVADALLQELRDPRVQDVSVTRVEVIPDLSRARILVMVRGGDVGKGEEALAGLESAAGYLRGRVARALSARTTPELEFVLDRGLEHAARIDELLNEIRRESGS